MALVAALAACHAKPKAEEAAATGSAGPPLFTNDLADVRQYLRTVDTVTRATFDVTWAPEAVRMGREEVIRSLRGISEDVLFETASAELNPASRPTLQQIGAIMKRHPDWRLTIEGHTDSIGGAASNLDLSNRRAAAVRTVLAGQYRVAADRLLTKGFGLTRPVEANTTIEGRARNRRVELVRACS
jgi:outer membrane protein OmpA-like peptidoglycan-associated protein